MNMKHSKQARCTCSGVRVFGHAATRLAAVAIPRTPRLAIGGSSIPCTTSRTRGPHLLSRRRARFPEVPLPRHIAGREGFVRRTPGRTDRGQRHLVQLDVPVGDQHLLAVPPADHHHMTAEVVLLGEVEVRQHPHVHPDHHRGARVQVRHERLLRLGRAGREGLLDGHARAHAGGAGRPSSPGRPTLVRPPRNGDWPFMCQYTNPTPEPRPSRRSSLIG